MNPLSSELPFHVTNWLIISLKYFCIVIRKWPTFWPSSLAAVLHHFLAPMMGNVNVKKFDLEG